MHVSPHVFLWLLVTFLAGCANTCGDDGGNGINLADSGVGFDGSGPQGATGPCGAPNEQCCPGAACDEGLRCGNALSCCGIPRGVPCEGNNDCCGGLSCVEGECLAMAGTPCLGSSDCAEGLGCIEGICGGPPPDCGAPGQPCCSDAEGETYCVSGEVCDNGADCESCGSMGEACCDGEVRCPDQGNTVCVEGQCQVPLACGSVGESCCGDGCVAGAVCNDEGACEAETGCGGEGQPCCGDGFCNTTQACVREDDAQAGPGECRPLSEVQAGDAMTPGTNGGDQDMDGEDDGCGKEGNRCCLPWFSCEAGLNCELLGLGSINTCKDCVRAGQSCGSGRGLFSNPLEGQDCCGLNVCLPGLGWGSRCCSPAGLFCNPLQGDLGCCGQARCEGFVCSCQEPNEQCSSFVDCCGFTRCRDGVCRECALAGEACENTRGCCDGNVCGEQMSGDGEMSQVCCRQQDSPCTNESDCCGFAACINGRCSCSAAGEPCMLGNDQECCDGICDEDPANPGLGICAANEPGEQLGGPCETPDDCRGSGVQCRPTMDPDEGRCCLRRGLSGCNDDGECCGRMTCNAGTCQGVPPGSECIIGSGDCVTAGTCAGDPPQCGG